jgi:hypothetical protein
MARLLLLALLILFLQPLESAAETLESNLSNILTQVRDLDPKILKLGLTAYQKVRAVGGDEQQILTIIDYSKPSYLPRLWVLDLKNNQVTFHEFVTHGKGSGVITANNFSDRNGSEQSSLGVFLTGQTYLGKHGYSLKLNGLEEGFNAHAASRAIVVHAANYATAAFAKQHGRLGLSWGCPAIDPHIAKPLINKIKEGTVVFAYYPDQHWLRSSQFLNS